MIFIVCRRTNDSTYTIRFTDLQIIVLCSRSRINTRTRGRDITGPLPYSAHQNNLVTTQGGYEELTMLYSNDILIMQSF